MTILILFLVAFLIIIGILAKYWLFTPVRNFEQEWREKMRRIRDASNKR